VESAVSHSAEAVLAGSVDELARLLRGERLDPVAWHPRRVDEIGHGVDVTWETFRVDRGRVVGRYAAPGMRSMAQIATQVNETVSPGVYCV